MFENEIKTLIFRFELRKKQLKSVFTSHFTISFELGLLELWRCLFPLDFHQLISGDSVDDSRRRLDQVGAKHELFHFMVSFLHAVLH